MGFEYTTSVIGTRGSVFVDFWNEYIHLFEYKEKHASTLLKRTESYAGISSHLLHHNATGFFSDFAGRILKGQKPWPLFLRAKSPCRLEQVPGLNLVTTGLHPRPSNESE